MLVCVRACVIDDDGSESAVAGNRAGPTFPSFQWWWLSIKGRLQCASYGVNPWTGLGEMAARALWAQKRSTDVGVPRHPQGPPWESYKEHSAVDGSEGWAR